MFLRKSCFEFRFPLNTFYLFQVTNISFRYTTEFEYSLGLYRNETFMKILYLMLVKCCKNKFVFDVN